MSSGDRLPNLIVIGAQKGGTTSLNAYLDLHPQVSMARIKETDFFLDIGNWRRGLDWYRSQFDPAAAVRGEVSPNYTNRPTSDQVPERIHRLLPEVRLVYVMRDPIARAISQYEHMRAVGHERRPFEEAVFDPQRDYLSQGRYAYQLEPYIELFGLDRIHLETQERLLGDRRTALSELFAFLQVDADFYSPEFERKWEQRAGRGTAYRLAWRASQWFRGRGVFLPRPVRWTAQRLLRLSGGSGHERGKIDEAIIDRLREEFSPENDRLRRLTGLTLSEWSS